MVRGWEKENFLLLWNRMGIKLRSHEKGDYHSCLSQIKETG